jgi:hypothetical protein
MSNGRKLRNGYVLKSVYCKKHKISIDVFNGTLLKLGFLCKNRYYVSNGNRITFDIRLGIDSKTGYQILPLHGSNMQGVFQYQERFLNDIFNKEQKSLPKVELDDFRINFGKYKGRLLSSMTTREEIGYCEWVFRTFFKGLSELDKSYDKTHIAFERFILQNKQNLGV